jgi:site-specific DNA recombinase
MPLTIKLNAFNVSYEKLAVNAVWRVAEMADAVVYARVSSKDQEREGYSIPAQLKLIREYAAKVGLRIVREFIDVETAKKAGRKQFGEMVQFLQSTPNCRIVIAEKTDRLYRNLRDCLTLEDLDLELHLPKEAQVISKNARSQAKLIHGFHVLMARNYVENLKEEVEKGMREKAEQGTYPSRPPIGYRNNTALRTIEVDPTKASLARRMFELYATGSHSLLTLRKALLVEFGERLAKGYLARLLRNVFYVGQFVWHGKLYKGTHTPLVSRDQFDRVQEILGARNKPKYGKRSFAFQGLLTCAHDNCAVTAEIKKSKYVYYHCTGFRGRCELPYMREETLSARLGGILQDIFIPAPIVAQLQDALLNDKGRQEAVQHQQRVNLEERLKSLRGRMEKAYIDKLDGKISEDFWARKNNEWTDDEQRICTQLAQINDVKPERLLDAAKILELAHNAHSLYLRQNPVEQAKLLKLVLSNCAIDATNLYPTYRKPFDLIFAQGKTEGWCGRRDSNPYGLSPTSS